MKVGAQNISTFSEGAYTGEISGSMLKECQCDYVVVGHSERRVLFHESDQECLQKVIMAQTHGIIPILCVGESLKEREHEQAFSVIEQQLMAVISDSRVNSQQLMIAYEPVWAIGTGKTATPAMAQDMHHFIRSLLSTHLGQDTAQNTRILYGGSVKSDNASMLLAQKDIDGALVGGASLVIESFTDIIRAASSVKRV
ncbi:MAG: triose-phosphate isomerase [Gammaproteobacteria bacterium]|nr:triose-phosphate isomerase [Gammaproteobacteria bacterium]